ncbi:MAG: right-handed parallel beta-helix repeat-containing protein [Candidatus Sumerlaeota bacterium]|nr:right-handed parallel beta-helix repeat-containing protein [Candidatus Sumerlaeota bacterium]
MRHSRPIGVTMLAFASLACFASGEAPMNADFYVAPNGSDHGPGTIEQPFATLGKARDAVREIKTRKADSDILVLLRGGTYPLREPVVFSLADSGATSQTLTYAAYPGEEPVFTSAVKIGGWKELTDYPAALPDKARGRVWAADIPETKDGKWRFLTLYDGAERLPRAKTGFDPTTPIPPGKSYMGKYDNELHFPPGALKNWPNLDDVEISIVPRARWQHNILGLQSVDEENGVAIPSLPCTYQMTKSPQRSPSCFVENVLEALDEPGEWVLNTHEGRLYLWPKGAEPGPDIQAPCLRELIRVEGGIDYDGPTDTPARNLVFRGLTLTMGDRYSWRKTDATTHSEWDLYDKDTALLRLRGAEHCVIDGCRFVMSGETAIRLDLYCQNNEVRNNSISHMGRAGIVLCGYGLGTKDVNKKNTIYNNHIHHIGELHWNGIGIYVSMSSENHIAHNLIHNTPFNAIALTGVKFWLLKDRSNRESLLVRYDEIGNDYSFKAVLPFIHTRNNLVEYNEIHHAVGELGDDNGVYLNTCGPGNVIRRNYIHDLSGKFKDAAIRTDDWVNGTVTAENILYRCVVAGVTLKHTNDILNNYIIDVPETGGTRTYIQVQDPPNTDAKIQRNICYDSGRYPTYPIQSSTSPNKKVSPLLQKCAVGRNLFYSAGDPGVWARIPKDQKVLLGDSVSADPLFMDVAKGDFRLRPDSPALKLGIVSLDVKEMGLTREYPERLRTKDSTIRTP